MLEEVVFIVHFGQSDPSFAMATFYRSDKGAKTFRVNGKNAERLGYAAKSAVESGRGILFPFVTTWASGWKLKMIEPPLHSDRGSTAATLYHSLSRSLEIFGDRPIYVANEDDYVETQDPWFMVVQVDIETGKIHNEDHIGLEPLIPAYVIEPGDPFEKEAIE